MSCTCNEAVPGKLWSGPCCCGSVTNLKGGIHPDTIKSATVDMALADYTVKTFVNGILVNKPIHIISATVAYACYSRITAGGSEHKQIQTRSPTDTAIQWALAPLCFSLYTLPSFVTGDLAKGGWGSVTGYDDGRTYIATGAVNSYMPHWQLPPDLFGYFCDGALFAEMNAPYTTQGIRITVNYIERAQFPPAYGDPVKVMQHSWECAHGEESEFLDGFYGGTSFDVDSSVTISGPTSDPRSSTSTNPASVLTTLHTTLSW